MSRQSKVLAKLRHARKTPSIYHIARRSKSMADIDGFVIGVSKEWVLIAQTMDGGYSDGLTAVMVRDITRVHADTSFETRFALNRSKPTPQDIQRSDVDKVNDVLWTMARLSNHTRLVAIHREKKWPGTYMVGRYQGRNRGWFGLLHVNPDASWDTGIIEYRLKHVTKVSINNHYLEALQFTAGEPAADVDVAPAH